MTSETAALLEPIAATQQPASILNEKIVPTAGEWHSVGFPLNYAAKQ